MKNSLIMVVLSTIVIVFIKFLLSNPSGQKDILAFCYPGMVLDAKNKGFLEVSNLPLVHQTNPFTMETVDCPVLDLTSAGMAASASYYKGHPHQENL